MFKAAIFDWDGTLADTREAIVTSFQTVLERAGCKVSDQFIARQIGIGTKNTFKNALEECRKPADDQLLEDYVRKKIETAVTLASQVRLFEGASSLLDELNGKLGRALASMNNRAVVEAMLASTGLTGYFETVLTADEVAKPKPDPEIFIKTSQKLNLDSSECVVFEDSIFGVEAAKRAGMGCVAVTTGSYSREELLKCKPDLIVSSLNKKELILSYVLR